MKLRVGLVVNPVAGLGGPVALKGSDGPGIVAEALRRGARPGAPERAARALRGLAPQTPILTWGGAMGEASCRLAGRACQRVGASGDPTSAADTLMAVRALVEAGVDLLVFAGGDGTARDVCEALAGRPVPALGVPAGCKMHSAVYAITPEAAADLLARLTAGEPLHVRAAEVRDIDEGAFRAGRVQSRFHGTLLVPADDRFIQQVKCGGRADEALEAIEIAAWVAETLDPGLTWLVGSGSTVAEVMHQLKLPNTLLGVDVVRGGRLIAADVTASEIQAVVGAGPARALLSFIGGQGHLFGRGNQQFTPDAIRRLGPGGLVVLATRAKLASLGGRPLVVDTGDPALDRDLCGLIPVICGYEEEVLYRIGSAEEPE